MLYLLAEYLGFEGLLNLVRYQTFRAGAAGVSIPAILSFGSFMTSFTHDPMPWAREE